MNNQYIIGDIHGCLTELKKLVALAPNDSDIYCTGDLIDRGPDSKGVIAFVRDNNIQVTLGNHELMAIECLPLLESVTTITQVVDKLIFTDWVLNGGMKMIIQYSTVASLIEDIKYLDTFPTSIIVPNGYKGLPLFISHTLQADVSNIGRTTEQLVWSRAQIPRTKLTVFNVFGHTPVSHQGHGTTPVINEELLIANIDTGAPYNAEGGGVLSAITFPSLEITQIKTIFKD